MELININEFKKKAKIRYVLNLILVLLLLAAVITGLVLSLLLSTLDYQINMIINIAVSILVALAAIFYFSNVFPIIRHYFKFYKNMSDIGLDHRRSRTFVEELDNKNIQHVNYRVLVFSYREGEKEYKENLYVLDNDIQYQVGNDYKITTYRNVIVRCEDLGHAND